MQQVYVCYACRVPLTEGSYGMFCCYLCKQLWCAPIRDANRRHTDDCMERLRQVLAHERALIVARTSGE
jgi:hypothetical protein